MELSRRFFKVPLRVYREASAKDVAEKIKERLDELEGKDGEDEEEIVIREDDFGWALGYLNLPYEQMKDAIWRDHLGDDDPKRAAEKGFRYTYVALPNEFVFVSTWKRERFEAELEKFLLAYEKQEPVSSK